ncbi:MAG: sn-glycerol-3-phosphate ABC transporter ATP-binding protein UgpC [Deltaproteobacteria bacterium]|nr:sn-glycerol-3-phosphate ABC transporter ATP-binding protein UgpC [Deltaproteobacteria bacterium]
MAEVTLKGVSKRYGKVLAVSDVNLEIEDGELLVLVGPSGCGKSTTLRMIAGLEEISEGDLSIGGQRVNDVHPKDRDIAMVFQSYALYPHMNVENNMSFGLKMRRIKKAEIKKRVGEAAEILGLTDLLKRKPKELSGGQRQRVAMGRAIVRKPKVFLFDEPLSNLDARLRVQVRAEIAKLHRRIGTTIIYVTHDQVEAMTLADRIVVMEGGIVQQVGAPLEVFEHPKNRFVAGFIGSPAMNFFPCQLTEESTLAGDGFIIPVPKSCKHAVTGRTGRVELGVRPVNLKIEDPIQPQKPDRFRATVEVKEPMGVETFLNLRIGDLEITVREEARTEVQVGNQVDVVPDMEQAHLFDKKTSEVIF